MTLNELIAQLIDIRDQVGEDMADEVDVMAEYNYGDRSRTRALTRPVAVKVVYTRETAYSDSSLAVETDEAGYTREYEGELVRDDETVVVGLLTSRR